MQLNSTKFKMKGISFLKTDEGLHPIMTETLKYASRISEQTAVLH